MINRVVLISDGSRRELSFEQFLELPLNQRIQLILERAATFYRGDTVIERSDAMRLLRGIKR